ncbi:hypothetical protein [Bacillus licheniformis]|uniref:hypothetical protein n=2 Tax=Bacillota TaxID=1239 RepID=UPI0011A2A1F4|nr:hypothetical protein [Bacillus licheniformis]MDE1407021.1 hypothetical protein [Bacillus licheniformis]
MNHIMGRELKNASYVDEITIGLYSEDEGTEGEFAIKWFKDEELGARLEAYDDSWFILNQCLDLI